jgi:hypothetical protein
LKILAGARLRYSASIISADAGAKQASMGRPLEEQEAVLDGKFVNAAYAMFEHGSPQPFPEPLPGVIPDPYELVAWLTMSDFFSWWREKPRFDGFVARHRQLWRP